MTSTPSSRFHLLVDARSIRSQPSGVGTSVYRHLYGLESLLASGELSAGSVTAIRYGPAMADPLYSALWDGFSHVRFVDCSHDPRRHPQSDLWQQIQLPRLCRQMGVTVLLSPAFVGPLRHRGFRHAVMIHDDLVWSEPLSYPWRFRKFLQVMTQASAVAADHVLFVSKDARRRICGRMPIKKRKTAVVHNAYDERYFFTPKRSPKRQRIVIMVASEERRKNHETALKAVRDIKDVHFVCVGFRGNHPAREEELMALAGENLSWEIAPPMEDHDLAALIRRCAVLIMPTHGEGFGLPLLESIACGTPVIASDIPVLREIGGDFVQYLPPNDSDQWKVAIEECLDRCTPIDPKAVGNYLEHFRPENTARELLKAVGWVG